MQIGEMVAIASAFVALAALAFNILKEGRSDALSAQAVRDKLDYISGNTRDIRDDVRALDRKLDDHAARITKMEARMDDHGRRIERLENVQ
ncbi:MAG: hypothetical protein IKF14_02075 [Atopobiaceae bacterium]|nr:hypothetical protein [Atopobiaceae bacterium]